MNILFIKIHLKSNSNSSCGEGTVACLSYFLQFKEVVGANFYGFALKAIGDAQITLTLVFERKRTKSDAYVPTKPK